MSLKRSITTQGGLRKRNPLLPLKQARKYVGNRVIETLMRFVAGGFRREAPNKFRFNALKLRYEHSYGAQGIGETVLTFTGNPVWVFAKYQFGTSAIGLDWATTEPISPTGWGYYAMYKFVASGTTWTLAPDGQGIRHIGDFYFDTPAR